MAATIASAKDPLTGPRYEREPMLLFRLLGWRLRLSILLLLLLFRLLPGQLRLLGLLHLVHLLLEDVPHLGGLLTGNLNTVGHKVLELGPLSRHIVDALELLEGRSYRPRKIVLAAVEDRTDYVHPALLLLGILVARLLGGEAAVLAGVLLGLGDALGVGHVLIAVEVLQAVHAGHVLLVPATPHLVVLLYRRLLHRLAADVAREEDHGF